MKKLVKNVKENWKSYLIILLLVVLVFGQSGSSVLSKVGISNYGSYDYAESLAYEGDYARSSIGYYPGGSDALDEENRKFIRNANVNLEVENYNTAKTSVKNSVVANGGIVLSESENKNYNDDRYLSLRVKLDSTKLDSFLDEIKSYGEVESINVYGNDVTGSYTDYSDRLERYQSQISKYNVMLSRELSVEEEVKVHTRIDQLEDQIFYLQNRLSDIDEDVDYSDVYISLSEKPSVLDEIDFLGLRDSFKLLVQALENALRFILQVVGFLIPFAILYALYLGFRRLNSKK